MIRLFFVVATALLVCQGFAVAGEKCRQIPMTKKIIDAGMPPGYIRVALVLPFDWGAIPHEKGIRYTIILNMDAKKARPDPDMWVLKIRACSRWAEYTVSGKRMESKDTQGRTQKWLGTPLLLPIEDVGKIFVQAWILGRHHEGRWEKEEGNDVLLLSPSD